MILTILFTLIYSALYALLTPLRLLPDATLPDGITTAISAANTHLAAVDTLVPVGALLTILGLFIGIEAGIFLYKTIMWLIKKIPTIN